MFLPEKMPIVPVMPGRPARIIRSWDKAGTQDGGCRTAGVKMAELADGSYVIMDVVTGQWRAERREAVIYQTARTDGHDVRVVIEQEPGSGGKESAENTVRNLKGYVVDVDRPTGNKALRAEPLAAQVNIGNVSLLEGAWNKDFLDELRSFPKGRYKDQVDAASQAFAALTRKSAIDYKRMMGKPQNRVNNILLPG